MSVINSYPRILTDETIREDTFHGNEEYPFQYYYEDIFQFDFHLIDWHWHPEVEFVFIEKGNATFLIGNKRYNLTAGQGVFINAQVIHRFESIESTIIPNIVFSPLLLSPKESLIYQKYIAPVLSSSTECQIFSQDVYWQQECLDILNTIFSLQKKQNSCELQTVRSLLYLWQIMCENIDITSVPTNNKVDIQDQARLQIMLQFIHENYRDNITLDTLTDVISLSKSSILNLFRKYLHTSPVDYIIHYKLKQAAHLLDTTENTIASIAKNSGFDNVPYFCRKFKEVFHLTPSQYRKASTNNIPYSQ